MFIDKIKNLIKKAKEPTLTTITEYVIEFHTIDGERHNSPLYLIDESMIRCKFLDYFLIGRDDYLKDENGVVYPINNIVSIKAIKLKEIENVVKQYFNGFRGYDMGLIWYLDYEVYKEDERNISW